MIEFYANGHSVFISDEDKDLLNYVWSTNDNDYVMREENKKKINLHKVIAERIGLFGQIDHKDRDRLNNQRDNLRLSTNTENAANSKLYKSNTTGYKGVYWHNQARKWMAGITYEGSFKSLGLHREPEDAARAYDKAAKIYFGEFAVLNFPESKPV